MAIRPPRTVRQRRPTRLIYDLTIIAIVATAVLLFALRTILSVLSVDTWTAAWRVVDLPTGLLVNPLERFEALSRTSVGDLTLATAILTVGTWVVALLVLGTLANRRG